MNTKTYLAVAELAQAAAHHHGLIGPTEFTVSHPHNHSFHAPHRRHDRPPRYRNRTK